MSAKEYLDIDFSVDIMDAGKGREIAGAQQREAGKGVKYRKISTYQVVHFLQSDVSVTAAAPIIGPTEPQIRKPPNPNPTRMAFVLKRKA